MVQLADRVSTEKAECPLFNRRIMNTSEPIDRDATLALIESMLCGEISADDAQRLRDLLHRSEAARLIYVEHIDLHAEMLRLAGRPVSRDVQTLLVRPVGGRRLRLLCWSLASVACLLLLVVPSVWFVLEGRRQSNREREFQQQVARTETIPTTEPAPVVARLVEVADAEWSELMPAHLLPTGTEWRAGQLVEIASGTALLDFVCGVRCAISGATLLQLDGPRSVTLDSGLATFEVPPQAVGFTVHTHGGSFTDLGTEFGVNVAFEGQSEVHVFRGLVDARADGEDGEEPVRQRLRAEQSVRLDPYSRSLIPVEFAPDHFTMPLSLASGVERFSEAVRFVAQPLEAVVPRGRDDGQTVFLCRERADVALPAALVVRAGWDFESAHDPSPGTRLSRGTRVSSFLLHCHPRHDDIVEGSITFLRPIAGVIVDAPDLAGSDSIFAPEETSLEGSDDVRRGLEEPGVDRKGRDLIRLQGPERRTLLFRFNRRQIDQVRILVHEDPQEKLRADSRP
jgi:hypothetical protein